MQLCFKKVELNLPEVTRSWVKNMCIVHPDIFKLLHECSCFIDFIKQVGENEKMRG